MRFHQIRVCWVSVPTRPADGRCDPRTAAVSGVRGRVLADAVGRADPVAHTAPRRLGVRRRPRPRAARGRGRLLPLAGARTDCVVVDRRGGAGDGGRARARPSPRAAGSPFGPGRLRIARRQPAVPRARDGARRPRDPRCRPPAAGVGAAVSRAGAHRGAGVGAGRCAVEGPVPVEPAVDRVRGPAPDPDRARARRAPVRPAGLARLRALRRDHEAGAGQDRGRP